MDEESPRERFLSSQEILSTIDWLDDLQEHQTALTAIALFDEHMTILLEAIVSLKAKKLSRFLKDVVMTLTRPIKALRRCREYVAADADSDIAKRIQKDESTFQSFEDRILASVAFLVKSTVKLWDGHQTFDLKLKPDQSNELNNQHYLLVYLILMVLDQWVATEYTNVSSVYFEHVNPQYKKFTPPGARHTVTEKRDTGAALRHLQSMMGLCIQCHLSIEDLLVWKPTPVFSTGINEEDDSYDEEALVEDNYPLSETGITTLVSGMIYTMTDPSGLSSQFTLPLALAQDWVFTAAGGLASGFLTSDESQHAMADKALLVLLYAIDRLPANEFKMEKLDYCTMDSSLDRMGLYQIFQVMVTFAATSASASHRFFTFQGLDKLIQSCEDDVKLYLLEQLVAPSCPFESMRAAAINLVKATVERAFQKLDQIRAENESLLRDGRPLGSQIQSPFTSPLLLKTFLQPIWRLDTKAFQHSPLKDEGAWHDKYDTFMHALNFYLFLLLRDSRDDNVTKIWNTTAVQETRRDFLEPLSERVQELKEDYIERMTLVEAAEAKENDYAPSSEPPKHSMRAKNGVVNFDIDVDSDESSADEEDDSDRRDSCKGNTRVNDTALDLNRSIMQLELMDELLERIQDLSASVS